MEQVWLYTGRLRLSELRDALCGCDRGCVERHLEAIIDRGWSSTWGQSMGGQLGTESLFIM